MAEFNNGLQLLPETRKKITIKVPGENKILNIGIVILVLTVSLIGGLGFYSSSLENTRNQLDAEITNLEQQRDKKAEANILTLNKQLGLLSNVLNSHITWSKALGKIEGLLQPQIQFESFSAAIADNKFEFKALTVNYTVIARQIAAFVSDDSITDVGLETVHTRTDGKLEFNMKLTFDKTKFVNQ